MPGAGAPGLCRRGMDRRFSGSVLASLSQSTGAAIKSPSRSRLEDIGEHDRAADWPGLCRSLRRALDGAFRFEFLEYLFQADAVGALDVKGAGDFALADLGRALRLFAGDEGEDIFARRLGARSRALS